ncbi:hypothetical protein LCAUW1_0436 [Lacticaseibacillus paracasei]|nr:hypothetical protein LCAUW1_0436 [Lacticaseibacillus paracasei]
MIKDEFKFIGKNKLILVSVLVIILIPFLYSIFFLKSVWDPYGDTQNLPVAVVNLDQPVTYQGKNLTLVSRRSINSRITKSLAGILFLKPKLIRE